MLYRRSSTKQKYIYKPKCASASPRHKKLHMLSRYTSKEIIKPFPSAQTSSNHILPNVIVSNTKPTPSGRDIVLCTTHLYPAVLQGQTYAKSFTQHNKQKSRPIRPPIGNAFSPKTTLNNEAKATLRKPSVQQNLIERK